MKPSCVRPLGHPGRKGALRARKALGEYDRRIIAGDDDEAFDQILDLDGAVERGKHGRAMRRRAAVAPGGFAHLQFIGELEAARRNRFEDDFRGHDLGGRSRRHEIIGILFEQDRERVGIDQYGMRNACLQQRRRSR